MRTERLVLVAAGVLAAACLTLAPGLAWSRGHTLVVALAPCPPWSVPPAAADERPSGIDVEILELLSVRLDLALVYRVASPAKCLEMMRKGQADLLVGQDVDPRHEDYLEYIVPPYVTSESIAFYTAPARAQAMDNYESLRRETIGVVRGESYFAQFNVDDELRKSPRATLAENFQRLQRGEISMVIADEAEADWWLGRHPETAAAVGKAALKYQGDRPLHFAFAKDARHSPLADDFGSALAGLIREGSIQAVLARHGLKP